MSKASKSSASEHVQLEGYEGHFEDFGPYTVGFETYTADAELAPLFVGLPDDRCQCPHMGYVIKGKLKFDFADGKEELYEAGDAYYGTGTRPDALRRDRRRGVQPHRRAAEDTRRGIEQHGGRGRRMMDKQRSAPASGTVHHPAPSSGHDQRRLNQPGRPSPDCAALDGLVGVCCVGERSRHSQRLAVTV